MKKNTLITTILSVIALAVVVGTLYFSNARADSSFLVTTTNTSGGVSDVVAQNLVNQINLLSGVNLKSSFFRSAAFNSLVDWSKPLPTEDVGRNNPFAPIGQ